MGRNVKNTDMYILMPLRFKFTDGQDPKCYINHLQQNGKLWQGGGGGGGREV